MASTLRTKYKKVKARQVLHGKPHLMPYGITQCYLPPDTSEHTLP